MANFQLPPGVELTPQAQAMLASQGHQIVPGDQAAPDPTLSQPSPQPQPGPQSAPATMPPSKLPSEQAQSQFGGQLYRAANQDVARVGAQQENTIVGQTKDYTDALNSLNALGHAYRYVNDGAGLPTGPGVEHGPTIFKGLGFDLELPGSLPWAQSIDERFGHVNGMAGPIASMVQPTLAAAGLSLDKKTMNEMGALEKASAMFRGQAANQAGGSPTQAGAAAQEGVFGVDKSQGQNNANIAALLQQQVKGALSAQAPAYWIRRFGDLNAVDPATGLSLGQYINGVAAQTPGLGPAIFDRSRYSPTLKLPNGQAFELEGMSRTLDQVVGALNNATGSSGFAADTYNPGKDMNAGAAEAALYALKQKHPLAGGNPAPNMIGANGATHMIRMPDGSFRPMQ